MWSVRWSDGFWGEGSGGFGREFWGVDGEEVAEGAQEAAGLGGGGEEFGDAGLGEGVGELGGEAGGLIGDGVDQPAAGAELGDDGFDGGQDALDDDVVAFAVEVPEGGAGFPGFLDVEVLALEQSAGLHGGPHVGAEGLECAGFLLHRLLRIGAAEAEDEDLDVAGAEAFDDFLDAGGDLAAAGVLVDDVIAADGDEGDVGALRHHIVEPAQGFP